MKILAGIYGLNSLSFLVNLLAIFVYTSLKGPAGYGAYGVYVVFMSIYYVVEIALVKAALSIFERHRQQEDDALACDRAVTFLLWALLPITVLSIPLIAVGNSLFPYDSATGVGGTFAAALAFGESLGSFTLVLATFRLTVERRFLAVYALRLAATLLRHLCAWSALWLFGSISIAILAILVKAAVIGLACWRWQAHKFRTDRRLAHRPHSSDFVLLASLVATALLLVLMQELPTTHIDRIYGREALGNYRLVYDISAAVWFVATIYPTVLFTHLLAVNASKGEAAAQSLQPLSEVISVFHVAYFCSLSALVGWESVLAGGYLRQLPFVLGVVAGVSILGYNRFLMEAAQALGKARWTVVATGGTVLVVLAVLGLAPRSRAMPEVALAWVVGQTVLMLGLKGILATVVRPSISSLRDVTTLLVPIGAILLLQSRLPLALFAIICTLGACLAGVLLLRLLIAQTRKSSPAKVHHG